MPKRKKPKHPQRKIQKTFTEKDSIIVQRLCTDRTEALYEAYKGSVRTVQKLCTMTLDGRIMII